MQKTLAPELRPAVAEAPVPLGKALQAAHEAEMGQAGVEEVDHSGAMGQHCWRAGLWRALPRGG